MILFGNGDGREQIGVFRLDRAGRDMMGFISRRLFCGDVLCGGTAQLLGFFTSAMRERICPLVMTLRERSTPTHSHRASVRSVL